MFYKQDAGLKERERERARAFYFSADAGHLKFMASFGTYTYALREIKASQQQNAIFRALCTAVAYFHARIYRNEREEKKSPKQLSAKSHIAAGLCRAIYINALTCAQSPRVCLSAFSSLSLTRARARPFTPGVICDLNNASFYINLHQIAGFSAQSVQFRRLLYNNRWMRERESERLREHEST